MRDLIYQFRLYVAEKFLSWALHVAPQDEDKGENIKGTVLRYFKSAETK